jgi:riboflavin biosynthesis pyrimidine reductase
MAFLHLRRCHRDRSCRALQTLNAELGIERIPLEGEAGLTMLRAGPVDELSLVVCPVVDGSSCSQYFRSGGVDLGPAPIERMALTSHEVLDGGAVWLRYRLNSAAS